MKALTSSCGWLAMARNAVRWNNCRQNSRLQSNVTFWGQQLEVARFFSAADVFVMSSVSEGLPMSLLQAFSIGLPAIVTDVGGMAEVVRLAQAGITVPVTDTVALAAAILELAANAGAPQPVFPERGCGFPGTLHSSSDGKGLHGAVSKYACGAAYLRRLKLLFQVGRPDRCMSALSKGVCLTSRHRVRPKHCESRFRARWCERS